jgi:hypothetical protein
VTDNLFTFTTSGGTPQLTGSVDADSALGQTGELEQPTAYSTALDDPGSDGPAPLATDSSGNFTTGTETTSAPCINAPNGGQHGGYLCPDRGKTVNWALAHTVPGTHKFYNGFTLDDCTDFSSRSLTFGGGLPEDIAPVPALPADKHNDKYWYQVHLWPFTYTSNSWANAYHLANFFLQQGSYYLKHANNAQPGYIIFAQWQGKAFKDMSHDGVITVIHGSNIYITQHSAARKNESLYRQAGRPHSWYGKNPHLTMWIAIPSRQA